VRPIGGLRDGHGHELRSEPVPEQRGVHLGVPQGNLWRSGVACAVASCVATCLPQLIAGNQTTTIANSIRTCPLFHIAFSTFWRVAPAAIIPTPVSLNAKGA